MQYLHHTGQCLSAGYVHIYISLAPHQNTKGLCDQITNFISFQNSGYVDQTLPRCVKTFGVRVVGASFVTVDKH